MAEGHVMVMNLNVTHNVTCDTVLMLRWLDGYLPVASCKNERFTLGWKEQTGCYVTKKIINMRSLYFDVSS
jgi:hypothetical protein